MKYVCDSSVPTSWYANNLHTPKALRLRGDFISGFHELLAPDSFPADCADLLAQYERKGVVAAGRAIIDLTDPWGVGITLHPVTAILERATVISVSSRLTVHVSLYVALAEKEQCELLTASPKLLRAARKHFPFITALASLP